jgi:hypothetical protein
MGEVDQASRVEKLLATQTAKLDGLFEGRRYEIVQEITPAFLEQKGRDKIQTPLGNRGRNGYLVRLIEGPEVDPSGYADDSVKLDAQGRQWFFVGATVLATMAEDYGAVDLPEKRTKKSET